MRIAAALVVVIALLGAGYIWLVGGWSYSSGERAGWVQKLSKKGWICKTWEGEMALVSMPGAMSEMFYFTARDDAVAEQLNKVMGKRVSLHYEEKVGLPTSCFGETRYYVTKVVDILDTQPAPGFAAPAPQPATPPAPPAPAAPAK
jgi:hypothetical protein